MAAVGGIIDTARYMQSELYFHHIRETQFRSYHHKPTTPPAPTSPTQTLQIWFFLKARKHYLMNFVCEM